MSADQFRGMAGALGADAYRDQPATGRYALPYNPMLERAYAIADEALPGQKHRPKHAKAPMTLREVTDLTMERIRRLGRKS